MYPPNVTHMPTKNAWLDLIDEAQTSIEIASFYWTLRFNELYPYNTSVEVSFLFHAAYRENLGLRHCSPLSVEFSRN